MIETLVTIGTDDGWAPPHVVRLDLVEDFIVTNVEETRWYSEVRGEVTRGAIYMRGLWRSVEIPGPIPVVPRQAVIFAAGALHISVELPVMPLGSRELPRPEGLHIGWPAAIAELESPYKRTIWKP